MGLELPCNYSQYQKACNEKYVTANNNDFLKSTDTVHLLHALATEYDSIVIIELSNEDKFNDRVLINLTSNAIKYTPMGGKVLFKVNQISPVKDGKTVFRFDIEDDGIGMSEEFQQHLFEAFSREKTSTVSKQQGAGLGLSIVKRIVDLSGGTIAVKSKQNEGSTFTVEIPVRVMDEEAIRKYEEDIKKTSSVGMDAHVAKPVDVNKLFETMKSLAR